MTAMIDGQQIPMIPLALLGHHLALAGDVLSAARDLIPAAQEAEPGEASRLEELSNALIEVEAALASAAHPLLAGRIAEAGREAPS